MPLDWKEIAHHAVDAAYALSLPAGSKKRWETDAERVTFLLTRHEQLTALGPAAAPQP